MGLMRRTGQRPVIYFDLLMMALALNHCAWAMVALQDQPPYAFAFDWLKAADLELALRFEASGISLGAAALTSFMVLMAQTYAMGYMEKEGSLARFFGLLSFFGATLCGLALSDSMVFSYALLEMLSLSTYLMVGFWYAQPLVVTAARDAFLIKRVGDVFLLMGVVALTCYAPGLTFSELANWALYQPLPAGVATLLALSMIAGPLGSCAQFPLNLWLDEAMEGPSPASLLRNSVVVGAGAYLLIKLQPALMLSPVASQFLILIGSITAVGASLVAIAQTDIKRALTHSTSAFFGLVFIAVGLQRIDIALLLMLSHGLGKALMFMSAGSVIMTTNCQDITELGGIWSRMPVTTLAFLVGGLGLSGVFPLGMFWTFHRWMAGPSPLWLIAVLLFANGLSLLNMTRVFRLVFWGTPQVKTRRTPEAPWPMVLPMVILLVVTLLLPVIAPGWLLSNFDSTAAILPMAMIFASGVVGCAAGMLIPLSRRASRPVGRNYRFFQDLLAYDFYLETVYEMTVVALVALSSKVASWVDRYVVDGLVNFVGIATLFGGQGLRYSASGQSQAYVVTILLGVAVLLLLITTWTDLGTDLGAEILRAVDILRVGAAG
jgi:NAD(P)H-quinone oxidoreductase subunit 5